MEPEKIIRHSRESIFAAQVATNRGIIVFEDDLSAQVHVIGNHSVRGIELIDAL